MEREGRFRQGEHVRSGPGLPVGMACVAVTPRGAAGKERMYGSHLGHSGAALGT